MKTEYSPLCDFAASAVRRGLAVFMITSHAVGSAAAPAPDVAACNAAHEGSHQAVLQTLPEAAVPLPATAAWLNDRLLRWGGVTDVAAGARLRLLHSARGGIVAAAGQAASGADSALPLQRHVQAFPAALAQR